MIFNFFKNKDEDDDKSYEEYDRLKEKLKKATKKKKEDKLDEAIEILKETFLEDKKNELPMSDRLRLPMYLQKANRNEEGWQELSRLLSTRSVGFDRCDILDKMSLFRKREKAYDDAMALGIQSYLEFIAVEKKFNNRKEVIKNLTKDSMIDSTIKKLIKKTKFEKKSNDVLNLVKSYIKKETYVNLNLYEDLKNILES